LQASAAALNRPARCRGGAAAAGVGGSEPFLAAYCQRIKPTNSVAAGLPLGRGFVEIDHLPGQVAMINPLTDENAAQKAIRTSLAKELNDTAEMLQFGRALPELIHPDIHAELGGVLVAPLALFVKAGMSFRGARMLCENALDRTAALVVRSMFETFLTIAFLLRRDVSLRHFSKGVETPVDLLGEKLTPEFRMAMYAAWCVVKDEQAIERMQYVPDLAPGGD
jgi:hypothetical protein